MLFVEFLPAEGTKIVITIRLSTALCAKMYHHRFFFPFGRT